MFLSIIGGMVECIINIYKPASVQEDKQYEEEAEISSVKPAVSLCSHHCNVSAALFTHSSELTSKMVFFVTTTIVLSWPSEPRPENSKIKLCKYYLLA